jgi:D-alanyl-D-alanine carboxypeptidase
MMITRRILVAATTLAVLLASGGCQNSPVREPGSPSAQTLQVTLDTWRARADVPAVVLGVSDSDAAPWLGASGTPELAGVVGVTTDARFRIASITKVFVAVVVLQLVEEGRLGLDEPASRYLAADAARHVTIRQLLNHTSGIPDYTMSDGFNKQLLEQRERRWTADEVLALVRDKESDFAPGTGYSYSNTDYILLGEVIKQISGRSWSQEVRRRILEPLSLDSTYIAGAESARGAVLPGYFDADNDGNVENVETGGPWPALETSEGPAGAMVSTAADLVTFGHALFRGRLVQEPTLRAMVTEGPYHPRFSNYGLGLEIMRPDYGTTIWGHGGFLPGFKSALWYVPSRDAVIVVLANDARANPADLAELVMRRLPIRAEDS